MNNNIKVLYCNPVFAAYRIPYYMELNKLFNNKLFVLYSSNRYENDIRFAKLKKEIPILMGEHAIPFKKEKHFYSKLICLSFTRGLIKKIAEIKPDVLITEGFGQWTPLIILYSLCAQKKIFISYERTLITEQNNSWIKTLHRKITNYFINGFLVNGILCKEYLQSIGIKEKKIFIGGMCADSKRMKKDIENISNIDRNNLKDKWGITKLNRSSCDL